MQVDKQIAQCFTKGFSWHRLKKTVLLEQRPTQGFTLEARIEQAKEAWLTALQQMEYADKDLLESAILLATACERRYIALLQEAREQEFKLWDKNQLTPVVAND